MPEENSTLPSIKDVPMEKWKKLAGKKIYFGHRSVGNNIIDGIKDLMEEYPYIKLNIVETTNTTDFNGGIFAHSKVGQNGKPKSKTSAFKKHINQGIGNKVDIAFFKFCFADIKANTIITEVFADYINTMLQLKPKYKDTTFIHITVPLETTKTSWKTWTKKLIGRKEIWEYDHNVARNEFNKLF